MTSFNLLKLKPFAVLAESDVVVSVRRLFSEIKMLLAARKPNGFDFNHYQEEATTPTTKPKAHNQVGLLGRLRAFNSVFMFRVKHQFCLFCSITVPKYISYIDS